VRALVIAITGAALAASASPAAAATAEVRFTPAYEGYRGNGGPAQESLDIKAAPGERSVLVLTGAASEAAVTVESGEGAIQAGRACAQLTPARVRCAFSVEQTLVAVETGPADDVIDLRGLSRPNVRMEAGAGDDRIWMAPTGGGVDAGPGADSVQGGDANDSIEDMDGSGSDVYALGGGRNAAQYGRRSESLSADLAEGTVTGAQERDVLTGVTVLGTGAGDDVLVGTGAPDKLDGGAGSDRVDGRGGADRITGGVAPRDDHDFLTGGDGDDQLEASPLGSATLDGGSGDDFLTGYGRRDIVSGGAGDDGINTGGGRDRIDAGAGDDTVSAFGVGTRVRCGRGGDRAQPDAGVTLGRDCERVTVDEWLEAQRRVRVGRRVAALKLYCSPRLGAFGCRGRVRVTCGSLKRPRRVGARGFRIRRARTASVRVGLVRAGSCRRRELRITVTRYARDGGGAFDTSVAWRPF